MWDLDSPRARFALLSHRFLAHLGGHMCASPIGTAKAMADLGFIDPFRAIDWRLNSVGVGPVCAEGAQVDPSAW